MSCCILLSGLVMDSQRGDRSVYGVGILGVTIGSDCRAGLFYQMFVSCVKEERSKGLLL